MSLSGSVVSIKPVCFCDCWCFSCSSWDHGHSNTEAGPQKEQPAFELSGGAAMRCSTLLAIFTGVILYLVLGAVVFRALEAPREESKHMILQDRRQDFLLNFSCVDSENLQVLIEVQLFLSWQEPLIICLLFLKFKCLKSFPFLTNNRWVDWASVF